MKKYVLLTIVFVLWSQLFYGQNPIVLNFDQDTNFKKYIYIDSSGSGNIWQVGRPNKTVFNTAYDFSNALVTDTLNTYPPNNYSSVILWQVVQMPTILVDYYYEMNSDTLTDYAQIEFSIDKGLAWSDLSQPTSLVHQWLVPQMYSGNSNGWKHASLAFGVENAGLVQGDTVLFKFSFTSDEIDTYKDGWMIDYMVITHSFDIGMNEGNSIESLMQFRFKGNSEIELINNNNKEELEKAQLRIFDLSGRQMCSFYVSTDAKSTYKLPEVFPGIYLYGITCNKNVLLSGKFAITR